MKTQIVTAETIEEFRRTHGATTRIGDTVQIREEQKYEGYRIYPETIAALAYIESLKARRASSGRKR